MTDSKTLSPEVVSMLRQVGEAIVAQPDLYDQWEPNTPECGTPGCLCGWVCYLFGKTQEDRHRYGKGYTLDIAQSILGLSDDQMNRLYHSENWPHQFEKEFLDAVLIRGNLVPNAPGAAHIAKRRIEHFIETDGAE